jgi:hypothetical protein
MERDIPEIRVGRYYFYLALVTAILLLSSGFKWNFLLEITGIYIPIIYLVIFGLSIAILFGFLDKVLGKTNIFVLIIYPIGFLISFAVVYLTFNFLNFESVKRIEIYTIVFISILPGFGLLKIFQHFYNNKLEDKYWDEIERNKTK